MIDVARIATRQMGAVEAPIITVSSPVEYRGQDQWDREYLLDVAAPASTDSYDLCGHGRLVGAICDDYGTAVHQLEVARSEVDGERNRHQSTVLELEVARDVLADMERQLINERAERIRIQALHAMVSRRLAEMSHRLLDTSFRRASATIRHLGSEITADTIVVDVVTP